MAGASKPFGAPRTAASEFLNVNLQSSGPGWTEQ